MDKITEIFNNGKKINVIKDMAVKTIGKEEADKVWIKARRLLTDILKNIRIYSQKSKSIPI